MKKWGSSQWKLLPGNSDSGAISRKQSTRLLFAVSNLVEFPAGVTSAGLAYSSFNYQPIDIIPDFQVHPFNVSMPFFDAACSETRN